MNSDEALTSPGVDAGERTISRWTGSLKTRFGMLVAGRRWSGSIWTFLLLQVVLLGAFFWPVLSGAAEFYHRDLPLYFEPLNRYLGEAVRDERFPLWNDMLYTGMPQVAVGHPNVFYPFTWIVALLPFSRGLGLYLLLHQLVLGAGMFLLVRRFRWGTLACWIAGFCGTWNGYITGLQSNYQLITAATWVPLLLWFLGGERRFRFTRRHFVGTALCEYLLIGSGAPELIGPGLALGVLWVAYLTYEQYQIGAVWLVPLVWRVGAGTSGLLLASPMILPALEWIRLSPREAGLSTVNVLAWSTEWYQWLGMLISRPFGMDPVLGVPRYVDSPFVGPVVLVLAVLGVWRARKYRIALWLAIFVFSCLITAGATTVAGPWMVNHIPGFSMVRFPVKLVLLPLGLIVLAAARGIHVLDVKRMTGKAILLSTLSLIAVVIAAMLSAQQPHRQWFWATVAPHPWSMPIEWRQTANTLLAQKLFGAALWLLLLVLALFARRRMWISRNGLKTAVLAGVSIPLVTSTWRYERNWMPVSVYSPEPSWDRVRALLGGAGLERMFRILPIDYTTDALITSKPWLQQRYRYGGEFTRNELFWVGHAASSRTLLLTNTAIDANIPSATGYEATPTKHYASLMTTAAIRASIAPDRIRQAGVTPSDRVLGRICAITAAKIIIVKPDPRATAARYFESGSLFQTVLDFPAFTADGSQAPRVYEARTARPRVYLTRSLSLLPDERSIGQTLTTSQETTFDRKLNHVYLVEKTGAGVAAALDGSSGSVAPLADEINLTQDRGERIRIKVSLSRAGLLVLADQYYPGWVATVDGTVVDVLAVNLINRGVLVPAGEHLVELRYRPGSLRWGLIACVVGIAALVLTSCILKPAREYQRA